METQQRPIQTSALVAAGFWMSEKLLNHEMGILIAPSSPEWGENSVRSSKVPPKELRLKKENFALTAVPWCLFSPTVSQVGQGTVRV